MKRIILLFSIGIFSISLFAQEECAFVLEEAQEMFDAGLIETIPEKLSGCLETGFTNEEKLQAFKLIILSYLFDDAIEKADEFMLKFLTEYPAYEPVATDPREFIVLMESYDRDPILMIGGGLGGNMSHVLPVLPQGANDFITHEGNWVAGGVGFHGSFYVERELIPQLILSGGVSFAQNRFDYYLDDDAEVIEPSAEVTDFSVLEYYETQNSFRFPVSLYYEFTSTDFRPYVRAGICPGVIVTASADALRSYVNTGNRYLNPIDNVQNIDMTDGRRMLNLWGFMGIGFNYKVGPGNFFVDAGYYANIFEQVRPGTNFFMFQDFIWSDYLVIDNFLLNNYGITAGYMFPIYRPKKKEQ